MRGALTLVRLIEKKNPFHTNMNTRSAVEMIPMRASGRTIEKNDFDLITSESAACMVKKTVAVQLGCAIIRIDRTGDTSIYTGGSEASLSP